MRRLHMLVCCVSHSVTLKVCYPWDQVTKGSLPKKKTTEIVKLVLPLLTPPLPPVIGEKNVGIVV